MKTIVCRAGNFCWLAASKLCRCAKLDADAGGLTTATPPVKSGPADVTLHIGLVDVTKDKTISTIGYNGQVPGPLIRLREGSKFRYSYLTTLTLPSSSPPEKSVLEGVE